MVKSDSRRNIHGYKLATVWLFLARNENAHIEWAFFQAKCLILLVAREGFEPPTFGL
jgi:hypothetical protein